MYAHVTLHVSSFRLSYGYNIKLPTTPRATKQICCFLVIAKNISLAFGLRRIDFPLVINVFSLSGISEPVTCGSSRIDQTVDREQGGIFRIVVAI